MKTFRPGAWNKLEGYEGGNFRIKEMKDLYDTDKSFKKAFNKLVKKTLDIYMTEIINSDKSSNLENIEDEEEIIKRILNEDEEEETPKVKKKNKIEFEDEEEETPKVKKKKTTL
jgi:hypothetical protein